ncbi:hypothetical protein C8Q77DRAFT_217561 [Trametes polyzona]|nr:hypothetical protein C8Q77DRAFT_217561 [Trametes polyzona]
MFARSGRLALAALSLLAGVAPSVVADFHIFNGTNGGKGFASKAVPSNHYSCLGWRAAPLIDDLPDVDSTAIAFSVRDLCGVPQLNFYNNGAGFDVYIHNGDGTVIGTCRAASGESINGAAACPDEFAVFDAYVCMSLVCG